MKMRVKALVPRFGFDGQTAVFVPRGMAGTVHMLEVRPGVKYQSSSPCHGMLCIFWEAVIIQDLNDELYGNDCLTLDWEETGVACEEVEFFDCIPGKPDPLPLG